MERQEIIRSFEKCNKVDHFIMRYKFKYSKKENLDERKQVIKCIQEINPLAAIGVIDEYEKESAKELIEELFSEKLSEYVGYVQYQKYEEHARKIVVSYFRVILIILKYLKESREETIKKIIHTTECVNEIAMAKYFAKVLADAIDSDEMPKNYDWESSYVQIITCFIKELNNTSIFTDCLENYLKEKKFRTSRIRNDVMLEYFYKLIEIKSYNGLKYFVERLWDRNKALFGKTDGEIIEMFCKVPAIRLITFCKEYIESRDETYTEKKWYEDVKRYNQDDEILKWMGVYQYIYELWQLVEVGKINEMYKKLEEAKQIRVFDIKKCNYMTKMVGRLSQIIDMLFDMDENVGRFLDELGDINLFAYKYIYYTGYYKKYTGISNICGYELIKKKLFKVSEPEQLLNIYMNTHLKFKIDLRDIVECLADKSSGETTIKKLFVPYPIEGCVSKISTKDAARNKIYLRPKHIFTEWTYSNACEIDKKNKGIQCSETQRAYANIIRNEEEWYWKNKAKAELLKEKDVCYFNIARYEAGFILADNIEKESYEFEEKAREQFLHIVLEWLEQISRERKVIEWDKTQKIYSVAHAQNTELKEKIAIKILEVIRDLKESPRELIKFVDLLTTQTFEEINEFRYIKEQKAMLFYFPNFQNSKKTIITFAKEIFEDSNITSKYKFKIYQNTCIKKCFSLEEACRYIAKEIFNPDEDECFVFPLAYDGEKRGYHRFIHGKNKNVIFSKYDFFYDGPEQFQRGMIYYVCLKNVDWENQRFYINRVYLDTKELNAWKRFLRILYDMKHQVSEQQVRSRLKQLSIDFSNEKRVSQFAYQLDRLFNNYRYDIERCNKVLEILEEKNVFAIKSVFSETLRKEFADSYKMAYDAFINDAKKNERGISIVYNVYCRSYFKLVVQEETFVNDLRNNGISELEIQNYSFYIKNAQ